MTSTIITKEQTKRHRIWADPAKFGDDDITAADIVAAVQVQLRSLIAWLDARRNNELWVNSSGDIEIEPKEIEAMIAGLKQCADACRTAIPMSGN
jgi:hypothetical protein